MSLTCVKCFIGLACSFCFIILFCSAWFDMLSIVCCGLFRSLLAYALRKKLNIYIKQGSNITRLSLVWQLWYLKKNVNYIYKFIQGSTFTRLSLIQQVCGIQKGCYLLGDVPHLVLFFSNQIHEYSQIISLYGLRAIDLFKNY